MDPTQSTSSAPPPGVELGGEQPAQASAGYEICLTIGGDQQITVSVEPAGGEMAEGAPGTPAKDIGEALAMALQIFKAGGQMPQPAQEAQSMNQGFSKVKQVGM